AMPLMATATGLALASTAAIRSCRLGACVARGVLNSLMSAPAENTRPPPVMTMPATVSSALAAASASARPRRMSRPSPLTGGLSKVMTAMPSRNVRVTAMSVPAPCGVEGRERSMPAPGSRAIPRTLREAPAEFGQHRNLRAKAQRVRVGRHAGACARGHALQDRGEPEQVVGQAEVPVPANARSGAALVGAHVIVFARYAERVEIEAAEAGEEVRRDVPAH